MNTKLIKKVSIIIDDLKKAHQSAEDIKKTLVQALEVNGWTKDEYWNRMPGDFKANDLKFMLKNQATPNISARLREPFIDTLESWLDRPDVKVVSIKPKDVSGYTKVWQKLVATGRAYGICMSSKQMKVTPHFPICFDDKNIHKFFRSHSKIPATPSIVQDLESKCKILVGS